MRPYWHITGLGPNGSSYTLGAYEQYSALVLLRSRFSPDSLGPDQDDLKTQTRLACTRQAQITATQLGCTFQRCMAPCLRANAPSNGGSSSCHWHQQQFITMSSDCLNMNIEAMLQPRPSPMRAALP